MKIYELFIPATLDIFETPLIGMDQELGIDITNPQILNNLKKQEGIDIEGLDLYSMKNNDLIIFALKKKEEILTVLIGREITDFPSDIKKPTIMVQRSWTPDNFRGKGYSPALYDGLARLGYRILSDTQVSLNARKVWDKLSQKYQLKAYNWKKKDYTTENPHNNPDVLFVLENYNDKFKAIKKKTSILEPTDYTFWTNPDIKRFLINK